ncbi:ATP-binding protein [Niveibacterium microcysteis]|uniref:histidine kinase n=1 Tax=Niveibacterium microcysteis TaxID=2811415 RepID=A0ABX7M2Z2_9RHOO|nr:ATP-binding protein [Niveibacterium microcysteis]QSI75528.1 HAMP domain-containing protein [Niveibacterium microcysteis]
MIRSFRFRLALLASLLTGAALLAFGGGAWALLRVQRLDRLDADLRAHAERETGRRRDVDDWRRIESRLAADLGFDDARALALAVSDGQGSDYRSPHWPAGLAMAALPWPAAAEGRVGEAPPRRPPREAPSAPPPPRQDEAGGDRPLPRDRPPRDRGGEDGSPAERPHVVSLTRRAGEQTWHVALAVAGGNRVAVAADEQVVAAEMAEVRRAFVWALPPVLLLVGFGAWLFSARALRPLKTLTAVSRELSVAALDRRIPAAGEDAEFVELIEVFNHMLARLERSFEQAQRFSADAAHELKTPLAILQGQLERAIQSAEAGSALQAQLADILDEVRRLSSISGKLLLLSRADAGRLRLHREAVDLSAALAELIEDARLLAPHLQINAKVPPGLVVQADGALLQQVLHNLLSNAIKYNTEYGWIRCEASAGAQGMTLRIANASHQPAPSDPEQWFARFVRGDVARTRAVDGVGLGLSVAREIARAHGGDLRWVPGPVGVVCFELQLR